MNLEEFLKSNHRNQWIFEAGINYYVRKCVVRKGMITLVSCSSRGDKVASFWRFLKRHKGKPFYMEQVINPDVAKYMRRLKWHEEDIGGVPQFISPEGCRLLEEQGWKLVEINGSSSYLHPRAVEYIKA